MQSAPHAGMGCRDDFAIRLVQVKAKIGLLLTEFPEVSLPRVQRLERQAKSICQDDWQGLSTTEFQIASVIDASGCAQEIIRRCSEYLAHLVDMQRSCKQVPGLESKVGARIKLHLRVCLGNRQDCFYLWHFMSSEGVQFKSTEWLPLLPLGTQWARGAPLNAMEASTQ